MNLSTLEPLIIKAKAPGEDQIFSLRYPKRTDLPSLIRNSGCRDRGNFLPRWRSVYIPDYPDMGYVIKRLPICANLTTRDVRAYFDLRFSTNIASTWELLVFANQHKNILRKILRRNEELIALGNDDFTQMDNSASVISRSDNDVWIISSIPLLNAKWARHHVFLLRSED